MNIILYILLCLGTALAQATVSDLIAPRGIFPDFYLIIACIIGFVGGEYKGLMMGLTLGLCQDLFSPGSLGLNIILKGLAGALAGATIHTISTITGPAVLMVTLALSLGSGLASLFVAYPVLDPWTLLHAFSSFLLPQGVYNALLTLGIILTIRKFQHSLGMVGFGYDRQ